MGKGKSPKVNATLGFLTLWHANRIICSLFNWVCRKKIPPFYPVSHNKPFLITADGGRKEAAGWAGAENGKMEISKSEWTLGFLTLGHSNWTICTQLNWFCHINCPPFYQASHNNPFLITAERGRKEAAGAEHGKREISKSECDTWVSDPGAFKLDNLQPV